MRYFLLLIFVSISFLSYGQKLKLGFRGGADFSNFYGHYLKGEIPNNSIQSADTNNPPILLTPRENDPQSKYYYKTDFIKDMRVGFFSYLFLDIELKKNLSIETGLGYSQKGIDMQFSQHKRSIMADNSEVLEQSYYFKRNFRLDYIVIPVTLQYSIDKNQRFYILGGIYNSFAVNFLIKNSLVTVNNITYHSSGEHTETVSSILDDKTYAKIFDSGLVAGFGVNILMTEKIKIGLDLRSSIGLVSIAGEYETHGFHSFSKQSKNISFETGLKLLYVLTKN